MIYDLLASFGPHNTVSLDILRLMFPRCCATFYTIYPLWTYPSIQPLGPDFRLYIEIPLLVAIMIFNVSYLPYLKKNVIWLIFII